MNDFKKVGKDFKKVGKDFDKFGKEFRKGVKRFGKRTEKATTNYFNNTSLGMNPIELSLTSYQRNLARMCRQSYSRSPSKNIGTFELMDLNYGSERPFEYLAYRSESRKEIVVAVRGTYTENSYEDYITDAEILFNMVITTGRYERIKQFYKNIVSQYGDTYDIKTTGHSLGGGLLYLLLADSRRENFLSPSGIVFNPLVALGVINKIPMNPKALTLTAFVIQGDMASELLLGRFLPPSRYKIFAPMFEGGTAFSHHGIRNFVRAR